MNNNKIYGYELVLDLTDCNNQLFNRESISNYFEEFCELIKMELCDIHFWDDLDVPENEKQTNPHTKGTSAVAFILTSSIVIHTLDDLNTVFVNIFSCKEFDFNLAKAFTQEWFCGYCHKSTNINRNLK